MSKIRDHAVKSITFDSELMTQYLPSTLVDETEYLVAVADENIEPIIFAIRNVETISGDGKSIISQRKKFFIIRKEKAKEGYSVKELGPMVGFKETYEAHTLGVTQEMSSGNIFLTLAWADKIGDPQSTLSILKPFARGEIGNLNPGYIINAAKPVMESTIEDIYMSSPLGPEIFGTLVLAYHTLKSITHVSDDIVRIDVSQKNSVWQWSYENGLKLPENPEKLLALQPVNILWDGIAGDVLAPAMISFLDENKPRLAISTLGTDKNTWTLTCPDDAQSLGAVTQKDSTTDLLIGGPHLYRFTAAQIHDANDRTKRPPPTVIKTRNDDPFDSTGELYVSQHKEDITLWGETVDKGISYMVATSLFNTDGDLQPIPLIPDGQGGKLTPFKAASDTPEQYIFTDDGKSISTIQRDPKTGYWQAVPLTTIISIDTTIEFKSYVIHVQMLDDTNDPIPNKDVLLTCTGTNNIFVNGKPILVGPGGVKVRTDSRGALSITTPTEGFSVESYTVSDLPSGSGGSASTTPNLIDPMHKVMNALKQLDSGNALKSATLHDGTPLLKGKSLSDDELDQAAQVISECVKFHNNPQTYKGVMPDIPFEDGWLDDAWNGFTHFLSKTWDKVEEYVIKPIERGIQCLIRFAEKTYQFILTGYKAAVEAITWVWNKVLDLGEKIIQWIGFLFEWDDIMDTHHTLNGLINSAVDSVPKYLPRYAQKVNSFIDLLKSSVNKWDPLDLDQEASSKRVDKTAVPSGGSNAMTSSKANWAFSQFEHNDSISHASMEKTSTDPTLGESWWNIINNIGKDFQDEFNAICDAIKDLFNATDIPTVGAVLEKVAKTTVLKLLDAIQQAIAALFKIAQSALDALSTAINKEISIPLFTWLYKKATGQPKGPSLLDIVTFIAAIPITIVHKSIFQNAPSSIKGTKFDDIFHPQNEATDHMVAYNKFAGAGNIVNQTLLDILGLIPSTLSGSSSDHAVTETHRSYSTIPGTYSVWGCVQDVIDIAAIVFTVPYWSDLPHSDLRWSSWGLGVAQTMSSIAIRHVPEAQEIAQKALAVLETALATTNFVIIIIIKNYEFKETYVGKDKTTSILDCIIAPLNEASTVLSDGSKFNPDPETKELMSLLSTAASAQANIINAYEITSSASLWIYHHVQPHL